MTNIEQLQLELKNTKELLKDSVDEKMALQKALWDILNYASLYIVFVDSEMRIKLANWSLATKLGFDNEKGIIGKCWLDFIKEEEKDRIKSIYYLFHTKSEKAKNYTETKSTLVLPDESTIAIKWFNIHINSLYNVTCSFGIQKNIPFEVTEDAMRAYYRDIIDTDQTMIKSIRDSILTSHIKGC